MAVYLRTILTVLLITFSSTLGFRFSSLYSLRDISLISFTSAKGSKTKAEGLRAMEAKR